MGICNFTPVSYRNFVIGLPRGGTLSLILNSNEERFGGRGDEQKKLLYAHKGGFWGWEYSATFDLPAMSALFFRYRPRKPAEKKAEKTEGKTSQSIRKSKKSR